MAFSASNHASEFAKATVPFAAGASTFTGAFSLEVPLRLPDGRAGFGPKLSLSYTNTGAPSVFGRGWSLSGLPSISIDPRDGIPRYDGGERFTFSLIGAITPVSGPASGEDLWVDRGSHWAMRYGACKEGGFIRIDRWIDKATGEAHWRTIDATGTVTIYGRAADGTSRISDPADTGRVHTWMPELQIDNRGNAIAYEYAAEDFQHVDRSSPSEWNRIATGVPPAQRYLKRVRWGNATPLSDDASVGSVHWCFEFVLDYGDHAQNPRVVRDRPWPARPDAFSDCSRGFEVRTYRLCRRLLVFHRLAEPPAEPTLVRSYVLGHESTPSSTLLEAVTVVGYRRNEELAETAGPESRSTPPLSFTYSRPLAASHFVTAPTMTVDTLPQGLDESKYRWIDLYGEGLPGLLFERGGGWHYQRNLGRGELGGDEPVLDRPSLPLGQAAVHDFDGDGNTDLAVYSSRSAGFYERDRTTGTWGGFRAFPAIPHLDAIAGRSQWVDIDGDGRADLVLASPSRIEWFRSRGKEGFESAREIQPDRAVLALEGGAPWRDEPVLDYFFADMNGDGLPDQVKIENGSVVYWPNLGNGRFAAPVVMDGSTRLAGEGSFDAGRIRFCDMDGTGTSDILYIGEGEIRIYRNAGGNLLLPPEIIPGLPMIDNAASVQVLDFYGDGTPHLVWSAHAAGGATAIQCLALTDGVRAGQLVEIDTTMGLKHRITYGSSSEHFVRDRLEGRAWTRTIPRHAFVVDRHEIIDEISDLRSETGYRYHDGSYDGRERRFRGFGVTEAYDARIEGSVSGAGPTPSCVRTWHHLGEDAVASAGLMWSGDGVAPRVPAAVLRETGQTLTARDAAHAMAAAEGAVVREEVFAVGPDGKPAGAPLTVRQAGLAVACLQAATATSKGRYLAQERESVTAIYEGQSVDPRISHEFILERGSHGTPLLVGAVAYPRRDVAALADPVQGEMIISLARARFHDADEDGRYDLAHPIEQEEFRVLGATPPASAVYAWDEMQALAMSALAASVSDANSAAGALLAVRTSWSRTYYWDEVGIAALPLGGVAVPARLHHVETAVFTEAMLDERYGPRADHALLTSLGYRSELGYWWKPEETYLYGGRPAFHRLEGLARVDGGVTHFSYDRWSLNVVEAVDALGKRTLTTYDDDALAPATVVDANGTQSDFIYDALGLLVARTWRGTAVDAEGRERGYGFAHRSDAALIAALSPETALADPAAAVAGLAERMVYDAHAWTTRRTPLVVVSLRRQSLVHDGEGGGTPEEAPIVSVGYLDGLGRALQTKTLVEAGPAVARRSDGSLELDASGSPVLRDVATRWLTSGHALRNSKQQVVRQFEPFYAAGVGYEDDAALQSFGVFQSFSHDAIGRQIRRDLPNGTFERVEFAPWCTTFWDLNDTVEGSSYRTMRDGLAQDHPERRALEATRRHAGTPRTDDLDPLGRRVRSSEADGEGTTRIERTRYGLDDEVALVIDARGLPALELWHDLDGRPVRRRTIDAGAGLVLHDALDRPVLAWDDRGIEVRREFDVLDRLLTVDVIEPGRPPRRVEGRLYGEALDPADAARRNVNGQLVQQLDEAGFSEVVRAVPSGAGAEVVRYIVSDPAAPVDWSTPDAVGLLPERFVSLACYDALGRPLRQSRPDGSETVARYGRHGGISELRLATSDGLVSDMAIFDAAVFNARGQRQSVRLGNGVVVEHEFDPLSWRTQVIRARTEGPGGRSLQELAYTYDPVGNIVRCVDAVQQPGTAGGFVQGLATPAERLFRYDAFYQLREAEGRVHKALLPQDHRTGAPSASVAKGARRLSLNDGGQLGRYTQTYSYDAAGNMTRLRHAGPGASWTNDHWVSAASNRSLHAHHDDGTPVAAPDARFDAAGNLVRPVHLEGIEWSWRNTLSRAVIVDRSQSGEPSDVESYAYDASGQRVRKRMQRLLAGGAVEHVDHVYLDGCEIKRITRAGTLELERLTTHVGDGEQRLAIVHRWRTDARSRETDTTAVARIRYQVGDHLGSSLLQLDEQARVITYEEYFPFGQSAFIASDEVREVEARDYRFCGKERDDATGYYYFGHRYYAPGSCRWLSPDPAGPVDGLNLYRYVHNSPITYFDPDGLQTRQRPGQYSDVQAETPQSFYAAFEQYSGPDRERLEGLMQRGRLAGYYSAIDRTYRFGTQQKMTALAEADRRRGANINRYRGAGRSQGRGGGRGGGSGSPGRRRRPAAGAAAGGTGGRAPRARTRASDEDCRQGGARGPGGRAGESSGRGRARDPGGAVADPADGGPGGASPGTGAAAGTGGGSGEAGTGSGAGASGEGPGSGSDADDQAAADAGTGADGTGAGDSAGPGDVGQGDAGRGDSREDAGPVGGARTGEGGIGAAASETTGGRPGARPGGSPRETDPDVRSGTDGGPPGSGDAGSRAGPVAGSATGTPSGTSDPGAASGGTPGTGGTGTGPGSARQPVPNAPGSGRGQEPLALVEGSRHRLPNLPAGHAAVSAWDSYQRGIYSRGNLQRAMERIAALEEALRRDALVEAMDIANDAASARNAAREAAQRRLSPGGRFVSRMIEEGRSIAELSEKYRRPPRHAPGRNAVWLRGKLSPGLPQAAPHNRFAPNIARNIAIGSGSTNQAMSVMSKIGKPLGIIGTAVGVGIGIYNIINAAPEDRGRVAAGEVGAFVGGAALGTLGTIAGAALVGLLVSNPAGWLVIGASIVVGGIAAYFGAEWGRNIGENIGEWIAS